MSEQAGIRIEQTTPEDIPLILTFVGELAEYERLSSSVSVNEGRLRTAMFGPTPCASSVIAYRGDEPVAFAIYYFNYSSFTGLPGLYLEDLFVRPSSRGSGIGLQLIRYLARKAFERGCGRMEWAVLNWNENAIRFYKSLGADPVEGWTIFRVSKERIEQLATSE